MKEEVLVKSKNFGAVPSQPSHLENVAKWMSFDENEFFYTTATLKYPVTRKSFEKFKNSFDGEGSNRHFLEIYHLPGDKHVGHFELKDINLENGTGTLAHIILGERDLRGKGFGKELCFLMADYGFNYCDLYRLSVSVHCCNLAAVTAYINGGFAMEGTIRDVIKRNGKRYSLYQMSLLRPEWEENLKKLKK
jgi:RimJ/RimL family protein N-acetyltransferase